MRGVSGDLLARGCLAFGRGVAFVNDREKKRCLQRWDIELIHLSLNTISFDLCADLGFLHIVGGL